MGSRELEAPVSDPQGRNADGEREHSPASAPTEVGPPPTKMMETSRAPAPEPAAPVSEPEPVTEQPITQDPPTQRRPEIEDEPTPLAAAVEDEETFDREPEAEPAPAAVRPLGRLGGDSWSLALDYATGPSTTAIDPRHLGSEALPFGDQALGTIVDDSDLPESQRPPPVPIVAQRTSEVTKLEEWLADSDERAAPDTHAAVAPATAALPFLVRWNHPAPGTSPFPGLWVDSPEVAPLTQLAPHDAAPAADPLPFADAAEAQRLERWIGQLLVPEQTEIGAEADRLEHWLRSLPTDEAPPPARLQPELGAEADRLEQWLTIALPSEPAFRPIVPNPIVEARHPVVVTKQEPPPRSEKAKPLLSLDVYAAVRVAVWDDNKPLLAVLESHGIEETVWRDNELRMAEVVGDEGIEGGSELVQRLRAAIRAECAKRDQDDGLMPLEDYAKLRAALDIGVDPLVVFEEHDLTADEWDKQREAWARRARKTPLLARQVRRAVGRERRKLKARKRAQDDA